MQLLAWNDYLNTGIAIVDQQHRGLVDLANETAAKLSSGADLSPEEMRTLLGFLLDYAEIHFSTEEALMALSGLDERHVEHHRQSHARFMQQVKAMVARMGGDNAITGPQMIEFLGNWLVYHMLGEDQSMSRQLRAVTAGTPAEKAYEPAGRQPLDPAQEAASRSLSHLYAFMANQNQQLLATEQEHRSRGDQLKDLVAERTAELNASEERFRALFHNGVLPIVIVPLDQNLMPGRVVDANPAACELLGYSLEEMLRLSPRDFVAQEELPRFPTLISELLVTGKFECEMTYVTKTGQRLVARLNMTHFVMHGQLVTLFIIQDISERKAAELAREENRQSSERLAQVRSEFLAAMSQQVNYPKNGALGLAPANVGDGVSPRQAAALLSDLPLFQDVAADDLAQLGVACQERSLAKGEILFEKGDSPHGLFLVIHGHVMLAVSSTQGNKKVLGIFGPKQTFGEAEVVMGSPYPFFAEAIEEAVVLQVAQRELVELLDRDRNLARKLLACVGLRLHDLVHDVESYTLRSGMERVIGYLLQHAYIHAQGRLEVELPARKQVIASLLHITPETLSRIFRDLSEAGLIHAKGRHVHIPDADRLSAWQASESSSSPAGRPRRVGGSD
ncbi:MAG: bacteriohemerythrin [Rhodocyclaceae bacterium]|nr:bacteriohemerythrin [Rhodocyclaceae bacterium]